MCGNTKSCVDPDKVCDGVSDCAGGEDEKKCTALIDDGPQGNMEALVSTRNTLTGYSVESGQTAKEPHFDQEALESTIVDTTTLYDFPADVRSEKLTDERSNLPSKSIDPESSLGNRDVGETRYAEENDKIAAAVSSREISSSLLRNGLTSGSGLRAEGNQTFAIATATFPRREIDSYNNNGYLSIRKRGRWGKLCLSDTDSILRERQAAWSIEDLAKAACKAITYQ